MAIEETESERKAARLWGTYVVPQLEGVKGVIEFIGTDLRCLMTIEGREVKLTKGGGQNADTVIASDEPQELLKLVQGRCNPVTALLQGKIEVKGDLLLLTKVAGSMPELARQADARGGAIGGA